MSDDKWGHSFYDVADNTGGPRNEALKLLSDKSNVRLCVNCRYFSTTEVVLHDLFGRAHHRRQHTCVRFLNQITGEPQLMAAESARSNEVLCGMLAKHFEPPAGVDVMKMLEKAREKA